MIKKIRNKGSALVIALLILSAILVGAISLSLISVRERKASIGSDQSNKAYQSADQGMEEIMQDIKKTTTDPTIPVSSLPNCDNVTGKIIKGDSEIELFDESDVTIACDSGSIPICDIEKMKSTGTSSTFKRAIESTVDFGLLCDTAVICDPTVPVNDNKYGGTNGIVDYPVIKMCDDQCWMQKNMDVGKKVVGSANQADNKTLSKTEKYCYEDQDGNCTEYGGLYQYETAVAGDEPNPDDHYPYLQGICPAGWHIPTDVEWHELEKCLWKEKGEDGPCDKNRNGWECNLAGKEMYKNGNNDFKAKQGGGYRKLDSTFADGNKKPYFWSSTEDGTEYLGRNLCNTYDTVNRDKYDKNFGYSVRCVKGEGYSGKPVIYLYPESTQEVKVQIYPQSIAQSIPEYKDGWKVLAHPDGKIINLSDNKEYPYLFWDGQSRTPRVDKNQGFVVKSEEVDSFLSDKLKAQGLNQKEADEFIEFWAPRMKKKDYTYVYFMPQADYDKLVPMTINPQPDTLIRVYMLFKSLDEPITVQEQTLSAPARKGFTAVEWGGDLMEVR